MVGCLDYYKEKAYTNVMDKAETIRIPAEHQCYSKMFSMLKEIGIVGNLLYCDWFVCLSSNCTSQQTNNKYKMHGYIFGVSP